jgi:2-oxoisovalerate dehydrogenase E1 component alpha subunit
VTYRVEGHSTSDDPRAYRAAEVVEPWRRKDPLLRMRTFLARRGLLDTEGEAHLREEVQARIRAAIREAETHPPRPPLETMIQGVYAEPLWQQRDQLDEIEAACDADPRVADPRHSGA